MFCQLCDEETGVRVEMLPGGGTAQRCVRGHALDEPQALRQVDGPPANGFVDADGVQVHFGLPGAPSAPRPRQAATKPDRAAAPAKVEALAARDALQTIKARRRAIRIEVKRLEALRLEDDELSAAESAIESARRAKKVRPIREAAS